MVVSMLTGMMPDWACTAGERRGGGAEQRADRVLASSERKPRHSARTGRQEQQQRDGQGLEHRARWHCVAKIPRSAINL